MTTEFEDKKLIDKNPAVSGLMVPLAIVLVGALIVFGVTRMLSTDRNYQDLVREMESKSFGNKWVAAYELSKVIASSQVPKEEIPELIKRLGYIYKSSKADPRTRDFIVVALGALNSRESLPILLLGLKDSDKNVQFHSLTSIGNMSTDKLDIEWGVILDLLKSKDTAIKQAAVLTLGAHKVDKAEVLIEGLLNDESRGVKYAAARVLISFKNQKAVPILEDMLNLKPDKDNKGNGLDARQVESLKLNVLNSIKKVKWLALNKTLLELSQKKSGGKVSLQAKEVLKLLKN